MKIGRLLLGSLFALALSCWVSAGIEVPELEVQKDTNGSDADSAPGPTIACGDLITWTYVVTNKAGDYIDIIGLTDSELRPITCAGLASRLLPGESVTCTAVGFAVEGQYVNTPTVTGELGEGQDAVEDTDDSHYLGVCPTSTPPHDSNVDQHLLSHAHCYNHSDIDQHLNCDGDSNVNQHVDFDSNGYCHHYKRLNADGNGHLDNWHTADQRDTATL